MIALFYLGLLFPTERDFKESFGITQSKYLASAMRRGKCSSHVKKGQYKNEVNVNPDCVIAFAIVNMADCYNRP